MSNRNSITNTELRKPLRRSARLLHNQKITPEAQNPKTSKSKPTTNCLQSSNSHPKPHKDFLKIKKSLDSGLRRSPRLNNGVDVSHSLRRSPRFSNKQNAEELVKKRTVSEDRVKISIICESNNKRKAKCEVGMGSSSCEQMEVIRSGVVLGLKAVRENGERKVRDVVKGSEEINVYRKRKQVEEGKVSGKIRGWTKEQEVALQRAYFATKPTPSFWKKVSKLVITFSFTHFWYSYIFLGR